MANVIRIKRRASGATGAPASLVSAELAYNEVDDVLYYGKGDSGGNATSIQAIAGTGAVVSLAGVQTVTGNKTFSGSVAVPTVAGADNSTNAASTAWVRTYVGGAATGAMIYQGTWDASTNTPALTSGTGTKGFFYKVSAAGSTTLDGNTNWTVGDVAAYNGTTWDKIEGGASDVVSVAGKVGVVTLVAADVGGLGTMATQNANAVAITGGSVAASTVSGNITGNAANVTDTVAIANGGTGSTSAATARTALGAAASGANSDVTSLTGLTTALTVAQGGTGSATLTGYVKGAGTSALTASAIIPNTDISGLGSMSTQSAAAVAITGGTIDGITLDGGTF